MKSLVFLACATILTAQAPIPMSVELLQVKRIYVSPLSGGASSEELRDLIIAGLDATRLFVLTDNPERADAVLKGAAEDHSFVDIFDSSSGISAKQNGGRGSSSSSTTRSSRSILGVSVSDNESHHMDEHKHEAYASVRLCNKDGDVLWSTTQESLGAKFKGASADVAAKIAHQLSIDVNRARQELPVQNAPPASK